MYSKIYQLIVSGGHLVSLLCCYCANLKESCMAMLMLASARHLRDIMLHLSKLSIDHSITTLYPTNML